MVSDEEGAASGMGTQAVPHRLMPEAGQAWAQGRCFDLGSCFAWRRDCQTGDSGVVVASLRSSCVHMGSGIRG